MNNLTDWVGKQEIRKELISQQPLDGFAALMDEDAPAPAIVPPGGHWMYFLPVDRQSRLASDGHAFKGDFLPPIELPRRMWAGGRLQFAAPIKTGDHTVKTSTIKSVAPKEGRTGKLVFVTVEHRVENEKGLCLTEEHDLVFREAANPNAPAKGLEPAPMDGAWDEEITPDPVLLFRYSALTFNGHRIHYDREYCLEEEGYPGLIIHGPLMGTLLMRLAEKRMGKPLKRFDFRNYNPIFDTASFTITGKPDGDDACTVWVRGPNGELGVKATAEF